MKPSLKRAVKRIALTLILPLLAGGCVTMPGQWRQTPITAGGVSAIPCRNLETITFAAPESGESETDENLFDTPETIKSIRWFNAAKSVSCP